MSRKSIPLKERKLDYLYIIFFVINFFFITYMVDLEQLVITDPNNFKYPLWPPAWMVDLVHWYGRTFDPVLMARPAWWRATIWIDSLFFGPFYAIAIYAFIKGKDWIRFGTIVWGSVMLTNVTIIMFEEINGEHASPDLAHVWLANLCWIIIPVMIMVLMWRSVYPFTVE